MYFPSLRSKPKSEGTAGGSTDPSPSGKDSKEPKDNITGKFDPSALERGAKALREIDASPNAKYAFEATKLQEITKQQELHKDIAQYQAHAAQRKTEAAKVEGEERRKSISKQQEEERVSARYKAQLETEAYQKKLEDQQRQNSEWLAQQHSQFERQEALRKKNEQEILEMRRQQMHEEKKLEQEATRARVRAETEGRIKEERDNIDIHLRKMRAQSGEARKTKLESIRAWSESIGGAYTSLTADKPRLYTFGGFLVSVAGGVYLARTGAHLLGRYVESVIGKPSLVRETSRAHWRARLRGIIPFLRPPSTTFQERVVLPAELSSRIRWTTNSLIAAKANGTPYRHLLLYGQPGTGKTLLARTLARECGMDYAIMSGGDIGPLGASGADELNRLFAWARRSRKGTIIFIDEADAFLRRGRASVGEMSENMRNALSVRTNARTLIMVLVYRPTDYSLTD
eukprot:GHVU01198735.1.p1 GENE.GHVU01198735.1~~GHVU01198735.1.p1  ORF type:complete len:458 (-),score=109.78 GHVU01198735.1:168-1541(-)